MTDKEIEDLVGNLPQYVMWNDTFPHGVTHWAGPYEVICVRGGLVTIYSQDEDVFKRISPQDLRLPTSEELEE